MSSAQHRDVFARCTRISREFQSQGQLEDSLAVLRALQTYLDVFPVLPDSSCQSMTQRSIEVIGSTLRSKGITQQ
jgi:hypothetical protein